MEIQPSVEGASSIEAPKFISNAFKFAIKEYKGLRERQQQNRLISLTEKVRDFGIANRGLFEQETTLGKVTLDTKDHLCMILTTSGEVDHDTSFSRYVVAVWDDETDQLSEITATQTMHSYWNGETTRSFSWKPNEQSHPNSLGRVVVVEDLANSLKLFDAHQGRYS